MRACLSALSVTSTLCPQLHLVVQLRQKEKRSTEHSKRNKRGSEQGYYARTVYHTKRMKDRGFTRLRYAHKGRREIGTEDMTFSSTFVFEGRERRDDYASTDRKG
jgi:hypothetical protein